jgi:hypothetical protein
MNGPNDPQSKPTRSALTPPPPVTTQITWRRCTTLPPDGEGGLYLLQLADGRITLGRRRTLRRVTRATGASEFVRGSSSPALPLTETHFVDQDSGASPIEGVRRWALLEEPPHP